RSCLLQQMATHRDLLPNNLQRVKNLGTLSPQSDASIKSLSLWLKELCGRGGRKSVRAEEMEDTKQSRPSGHNRAEAHRISQYQSSMNRTCLSLQPDGVYS
ncbi:mCG1030867, isoform CRA_a, partial [Mus musculus]